MEAEEYYAIVEVPEKMGSYLSSGRIADAGPKAAITPLFNQQKVNGSPFKSDHNYYLVKVVARLYTEVVPPPPPPQPVKQWVRIDYK